MKIFLSSLFCIMLISGVAYAQAPVANFSANQTSACDPAVISFTDLSTGNPTSWSWDFGNGNTSVLQNPGTSYLTPGNYTVQLTVTNSSGSNTKTITNYIHINPSPTVSFTSSDSQVCPGSTINFTSAVTLNSTGTGSYLWNLNGSTYTTANASYTYNVSGAYVASLFVSNNIGCTTSVSHNITVWQKPVTTVTASPQHICTLGGSTTLTATSTGTGPFTYSWVFGDGGTGTGSSPTHSYAGLGSYNVQVITTDGHGCKDTLNLPNFITVTQITAAFTSNTPICAGQLAQFTNTTTGSITTLVWDFGDGTNSFTSPGYHSYTAGSSYNVKLTVSGSGCIDSVIHTVVVWPKPVVSFIDTPHYPCAPPVSIQFNNTTTGASSYLWTFGDGGNGSSTSPSHVYNTNGVFKVTLVATSANGCVDSLSRYDSVYSPVLSINAQPNGGCIPFNVNFSYQLGAINLGISATPITYPYAVTSVLWNFGDGTTSTLAAPPPHTYSIYGSYPVTLTITTANGCTIVKTDTIHAGTPPTANFSATPDTVCIHGTVYFTNLSSSNVTHWEWQFGDGGNANGPNPTHQYEHAGVFTVKLTVYNNGCPDTISKVNYIVVKDPEAKYSVHFSCDTPTKVTFINSTTNYTSLTWYFGDGSSSTATNPTHTYASLGTYAVSLATHNSITGCSDSLTKNITLLKLSPNFTVNDSTICLGQSSTFTDATTGGAVARYYWYLDGIQMMDSTSTVTYVFSNPGIHHIKLEVKDEHDCLTSIIKSIIVGHPSAAWSAAPPAGCAPATITFTDASSYPAGTFGVTRYWKFGDGTTATVTTATVSHLYNNPGSYDITLIVTDNIGCTDSVLSVGGVTINKVIANFSVNNTTVCAGVPVFFQNTTSGNNLQYLWDFGDGTTSTTTSALHAYATAGMYTVKLVAHDNIGCADSLIRPAYINVQPKPHAAFTLSDTFSICPPMLIQTTNTSTGGTQYAWTFGNSASSVLANPAITYGASGIYDVMLIVSSTAGCKDTAKGRVRILGYAGALTYTPLTGCAPLTVTFTANNVSMVPGLIFDFADGVTTATTSTTVTHTYTQVGPYVPKLIMTDNAGCSSSSIGLDTIKVDGIYAGFTFSPYPACVSGTLTFLDTSRGAYSPITSRLWKFHDGTTASGISPTHFYSAPGTYPVKLITTTATGCVDTLNSSVTFWNLPSIDAGADTTICLSDSARLNPTGGISYIWSPGATLSCTSCVHPAAFPVSQTTYTVTGTDIHGCKNIDTVTVRIKTKTDGRVGAGGEVCQGVPVQLSASGGTSYTWLPSTGLNSTNSATPTATPQVTTRYLVITKLGSCLPDSDYVDVIIHPLPLLDAGPSQTIIAGNVAQLQATGSAYIARWAWTPEDVLSCTTCPAPEATPKRTTTFTLEATTDFNCTATDTVTIFVLCDNSQVFVPNTFTPNGNNVNDKFYVHGKGIEIIKSFRVYDRWGEVVFERRNINVNDIQQGWDGTFKGTLLPPDVYVFIVDAICDTGDPVSWKGDVMLLR